jgi:hypothetical protein
MIIYIVRQQCMHGAEKEANRVGQRVAAKVGWWIMDS